jgi:hypothetical protein
MLDGLALWLPIYIHGLIVYVHGLMGFDHIMHRIEDFLFFHQTLDGAMALATPLPLPLSIGCARASIDETTLSHKMHLGDKKCHHAWQPRRPNKPTWWFGGPDVVRLFT